MKYNILFLLFFLSNQANTYGQSHYLLDNFKGYKDKDKVILNWTIKKGSTCVGTGILRSTDQLNYEVIGEIKGICGNGESAQAYSFIDENPIKNKTNYYVLELGFSGKTEPPVSVKFLDFSQSGYKMIPNPIIEMGYLYFENPKNTQHTLHLYNINGKFAKTLKTTLDYFLIDLTELNEVILTPFVYNDSMYVFYIENESQEIITSGKLIKFRLH